MLASSGTSRSEGLGALGPRGESDHCELAPRLDREGVHASGYCRTFAYLRRCERRLGSVGAIAVLRIM